MAAPSAWPHSDDGEMMLAIAAAILEVGEVDEARVLASLAARYDPRRGYGRGARATFEAFEAGASWRDASRAIWPEGSRGNGAAVRVAPIAARWRDAPEDDVAERARRSAQPTHGHEDGASGAAVIAVALQRVLRDESLDGIERLASPALAARIVEARALRSAPVGRAARRLGCGVLATDAVPAALWAFDEGGGFEARVTRAIRMGGDTDSIAAMTGALAGAALGAGAIPAAWLAALEPEAVAAVERFGRALQAGQAV